MSNPLGQLRTVMMNVKDMDKACRFYGDTMGLSLQFRDGDRWAAFDAGGVTLGLAGQSERAAEKIALNFKVADVEQAVDHIVASGGRLESAVVTGAHERRASVRDADGHLIILYSPLPKT